MGEIETIHWFVREECNISPRCAFCFAPRKDIVRGSDDRDRSIANLLVENRIKKVIKTGGEPLLARNINGSLEILKTGGVEVSVHTNGLKLSESLIKSWSGLVDTIAIPIDAVSEDVQIKLRGRQFTETVSKKISYWINLIHNQGIKVSLHSVFTPLNEKEIGKIYRHIKEEPFDNWSIFEFNPDSGAKEADLMSGYDGSYCLAGTDGIMADFFLSEEKMINKYHDSRVRFVARHDRLPYYFLRPDANVWFYPSHLSDRVRLGSLSEGFISLANKSEQIITDTSAEFFGVEAEFPLWRRIHEGNYTDEDFEGVDGRCWRRVEHLIGWLEKRESTVLK